MTNVKGGCPGCGLGFTVGDPVMVLRPMVVAHRRCAPLGFLIKLDARIPRETVLMEDESGVFHAITNIGDEKPNE